MSLDPRSRRFQTLDPISLHCLQWSPVDADVADLLPPIVLLHGGGANAYWWAHLAPRMARGREVFALDFRGHGDSDHPADRYVGAFNTDLEAMIEWLGREDVLLIGHSLGAAVALDHASRFPRTRGIALIDLARGGSPGGGRRARLALALRRTYKSREEAIERFRFLPESSHAEESLRADIAEHSIQREADGRFGYKFDPGWFSLPSRPRPNLDDVLCPTLLVRGGDSTLLSAEAAARFIERIRLGRLTEIRDAGHHVLLDQPDRLLEVLDGFIRSVDATQPGDT